MELGRERDMATCDSALKVVQRSKSCPHRLKLSESWVQSDRARPIPGKSSRDLENTVNPGHFADWIRPKLGRARRDSSAKFGPPSLPRDLRCRPKLRRVRATPAAGQKGSLEVDRGRPPRPRLCTRSGAAGTAFDAADLALRLRCVKVVPMSPTFLQSLDLRCRLRPRFGRCHTKFAVVCRTSPKTGKHGHGSADVYRCRPEFRKRGWGTCGGSAVKGASWRCVAAGPKSGPGVAEVWPEMGAHGSDPNDNSCLRHG